MCLGVATLHRINKIVFACPDPHGGATHLDPKGLGEWYVQNWPTVKMGSFREESYDLVIKFLKTGRFNNWETMLDLFQNMHNSW